MIKNYDIINNVFINLFRLITNISKSIIYITEIRIFKYINKYNSFII